MELTITKVSVGPMDNNAYLLRCRATGEQLLIDAANEPQRLLSLIGDSGLARVVTTHRHPDHWQALAAVLAATGARAVAHPEDAAALPVKVDEPVVEVKAVGIPVLTDKVDIAHARLEFAGGAVANITASRVSTERVRKMRFFQQHEYISLDYARRDALRIGVKKPGPQPEFAFEKLNTPAVEPLHAELQAFVDAAGSRKEPRTNGAAGRAALELAGRVMASIQEHAARVNVLGSRQSASVPGDRKAAGLDVFATHDKTR